MDKEQTATLVLQDGSVYQGKAFGYIGSTAGEVVFNTAMTGYPENLTDPSYKGQILISTYPLVGNYGVPGSAIQSGIMEHYESSKVQVSGFIIQEYSFDYSHWNAAISLDEWLKQHKVPGIYDIDTRALTKKLREHGSLLGKIIVDNADIDFYDPNADNLVEQVSISQKQVYGEGKYKILLVDCGVKNNIIRCLLNRDATVIRVPW
ncbi:MAG: carbamoyl-phosphate synthase (glutamine-hydrolyzing) small subunit, partial [Calditrichia bacterium]|nr:carbamoyl-phosphate synthase (glutamine-hydrolyzing) small subunit [Calditrichia bacterium]